MRLLRRQESCRPAPVRRPLRGHCHQHRRIDPAVIAMSTHTRLGSPLFTAAQIQERVEAIADEIAAFYGASEFSVVAIMKGGFIFTADLIRALARRHVHPLVDFMSFSSYGASTSSSRNVTLKHSWSLPITGRQILLVDDILDTGHTIEVAKSLLTREGAARVRVCVLLDKPSRREVPVTADHTGFQVDNVFVVGYGLDYDNRFREQPDLAVLNFDPAP